MDFAQVLSAYRKSANGKRKSTECTRFERQLGKEILLLTSEINAKSYFPGQSRCFVVTKPKAREIWASPFRDRIVHHLVVDHLESIYEKSFSKKSFACRKNMGLHAAIKDLQGQVRRLSQGGRKNVWALKLDIESFFVTIDRRILKKILLGKVTDPDISFLIEQIFKADPRENFKKCGWSESFQLIPERKSWLSKNRDQGIPIGNLTSQFGANFYLTALDHFIERTIKPSGYLRYMDDLLILGTSRISLMDIEDKVDQWLNLNRHQKLNREKTKLHPLTVGMDYLGVFIKQVWEPKEPLLIYPTGKKKWALIEEFIFLKEHNWEINDVLHDLAFPDKSKNRKSLQKVNSRIGHLINTKSYKFRRNTVTHFLERVQGADFLKVAPDFSSIKYNG